MILKKFLLVTSPTPIKSDRDKDLEKRVLLQIYKRVLSLELEFSILKENILKLMRVGTHSDNEATKTHIKIIDTFDAMMFSFHMITLGKISHLAPFLYYINPNKKKSFVSYLKKANSSKYSFFKIKTYIFISTNPYKFYLNIYESIIRNSFNKKDIEMILEYEKVITKTRHNSSNQESRAVDFKNNLGIENFTDKLSMLINIFQNNSHYRAWLRIYNSQRVISKEELNISLLHLRQNPL